MKIDINKKYRTRDGNAVTFLHRAPEGWPTKWAWRGMVDGKQATWTDEGHHIHGGNDDWDLIEVREPREWWIIPNGECSVSGRAYTIQQCNGQGEPIKGQIRVREIID